LTENAQRGTGVQVVWGVYLIGEVIEATPPTKTVNKTDSTSHDNIGGVETSTPSSIAQSDGTVKIFYYGSTAQNALETDMDARTIRQVQFIMPPTFAGGGISYTCNAYIGGIKPSWPMKGNVTWDITLCPTSALTKVSTWATGLTTPFFVVKDEHTTSMQSLVSPTAAAAVYEYEAGCYADNASFNITPTATTGTIYVNGVVVATGVASGAITPPTSSGQAVVSNIMVTETGKTPKIYLIRVTKGFSNHA
jgi:hypothetical protein